VFSHSPLAVIEECFAHVGRVLRPAGWFDFTFDRTEGKEHHVLREDFTTALKLWSASPRNMALTRCS
jgi:hypothetical protein